MTRRRHRRHSIPFKRMIVEAYLNGTTLTALSVEHDICRHLIRTWIDKYEKGDFDSEAVEAELIPEYEARIAALERLVGRQTLEIAFLKTARMRKASGRAARVHPSLLGRWALDPTGMRIDGPVAVYLFHAKQPRPEEERIVAEIKDIVSTFNGYGYRRVTAELRLRGMIVNSKKVRRIMHENGLSPRKKRRYVVTTDSDHDNPIYPNVARGFEVHGPNKLWVGDITYVAIATGFVYLAVVLDVWSRKVVVVGYALGKRVDLRLTTAALRAAIAARKPTPGCLFHSDRGVQ